MNNSSRNEYDYIIIGAGISGLSCGIYLQQMGYSVLICEKHSKPGGYVHSFTRKRKYIFDSAVRIVAGAESGLLNDLLKSLDIESSDKFIKISDVYKADFPDFSYYSGNTIEDFKEKLFLLFPNDVEGINSLFEVMEDLYEETVYVQTHSSESILNSEIFRDYSSTPFSEMIDRYVKNEKFTSALSALWGFFGTIPESASAIYYSYAILSFFKEGAYYVKGSFEEFTKTLASKFLELGGELQVRTEVTKIILDEETKLARAIQVKRKNEQINTRLGIISSGDMMKFLNELMDESVFSSRYLKRIKKLAVPYSVFQTYLVTGLDLTKLGLAHENFYFNDYDSKKTFADFSNVHGNRIAAFSISCPSIVDNSLAPEKENTLVLSTFVPYEIEGGWKAIKNDYEQKLINEASKKINGLKENILFKESGTPETMVRYTQNYKGSPYGWEQNISQMYKRPQMVTPIKNLYQIGHWTNTGGGIVSSLLSSFNLKEHLKKNRVQ